MVANANASPAAVVAADTSAARRGAAVAVGLNYYDLGRQTGKIVVRILKGEAPGAIPVQTSNTVELFVNPEAARKQGLTLSDEIVKSAKTVVR